MLMTVVALGHHHHSASGVIDTLLYIVAVVATIVAVVGILLSLLPSAPRMRIFVNWPYAAVVAIVAWLLLWLL